VNEKSVVRLSEREVATEMKSRIAGYWRCVRPEFGAQVGRELDGRRGGAHRGRQDLTNRTLPLAASAM
jgi:hypothetical protein